ncbi:bis(5-nucleosyl)-tetraphosphatase [Niveomyces insectorum RCEF 264]|uniref:Bis(5-nucleosyl)-tetraphosphatase n=1 Tax=Niveomyces insectorum RCEF 264 TaxID=1081102 RepID=A0A167X047_9HYPO|nr:bis(5-nucleosyl)-tetraphosphatase [Niveomyces insectorum RCEF 264]
MTPPVVAPANLPDLVRAAFARARAAGDLTFFPTQVALLRVHGVPFQLRFAPALAHKPKAPRPSGGGGRPADTTNPFANPPPGLVVLPQLGPSHRLLLNKFAVCPDHAILATTAVRPQHHLLDAADLAAAYACIEAYHAAAADDPSGGGHNSDDDDDGLFIFYNSGPHSGASQPHRHLQLLPVARMREGLPAADAAAWGVLADRLTGEDEATDDLPLCEQGRVPARISYNLAITHRTMALCPRVAERAPVVVPGSSSSSSPAGSVSPNGTLLAGTALVKTEAEWDALRSDPDQLARILQQVGVSASPRPEAAS